jgi:hypothetical protein
MTQSSITTKQIAEMTFSAVADFQQNQHQPEFADVVAIAMNTWCEFNEGAPDKKEWHKVECSIRYYLNKLQEEHGISFKKDVRKTGRPTKKQQFRRGFAEAIAQVI